MASNEKKRCTRFDLSILKTSDPNGDVYGYWLRGNSSETFGYCLLCDLKISCEKKGGGAFRQHATSFSHKEKANIHRNGEGVLKNFSGKGQQALNFKPPSSNDPWSPGSSYRLRTLDDNVTFAEAVYATSTAVCALPYNVADTLTEVFPIMFPDSEIAAQFKCGRQKTSYLISDGIGPHLHDVVGNEVRNSALVFTAIIDEATTAQHWRQFDIILRYWSESESAIVVQHYKSFKLGKATANRLLECLIEAFTELYTRKLIQISTDGPSVMKCLQKKAKSEINPNLIDIGTCNLHKVHNAFAAALEKFGSAIDTLAINVFSVFKYSGVKKETYQNMSLDVQFSLEHAFLRHVSSRWLTLADVNDRLHEQLPALREYFLKHVNHPTDKEKVIANLLSDMTLEPLMLFIRSVSTLFHEFVRKFQAEGPLIHVLYSGMNNLILNVMRRFLKTEVVGSLEGVQLKNIDLEKSENWLRKPEIGVNTEKLLLKLKNDKKITESQYKEIFLKARSFYKKAVTELLRTLPISNKILKDIQVIGPELRTCETAIESVKRLSKLFSNFLPELQGDSLDVLIDEWKMFQVEDIPQNWYKMLVPSTASECEEELSDLSDTASDVESEAREDVSKNTEKFKYVRLDHFYRQVFQIRKPGDVTTSDVKYSVLPKFIKVCLTLSHGNADVERGFSENKLLVTNIRNRLSTDSINGLRTVRSYMHRYKKKPGRLPFSKSLMTHIRKARENYRKRLADKREKAKAVKKLNSSPIPKTPTEMEANMALGKRLLAQATKDMAQAVAKKDWKKVETVQAVMEKAETLISDNSNTKSK